jgi:hypothetical protein
MLGVTEDAPVGDQTPLDARLRDFEKLGRDELLRSTGG